jgi:hypothetical protein
VKSIAETETVKKKYQQHSDSTNRIQFWHSGAQEIFRR